MRASGNLYNLHFFRQYRALSTRPEVYRLELGPGIKAVIAQRDYEITKFFTENPKAQLKPFDFMKAHKEIISSADEIINADPIFKEQLEYVREIDPEIVLVQGVNLSTSLSRFPKTKRDLEDPDFSKETLSSLLTISSFSHLFGIEPTKPSFIFSQKTTSDELSSTNTELPYHSDGWQKHPDQKGLDACLVLFGIIGNKQVLTEVVTLRKILETLRESGQEELIEKLSKDHFISFDDFLPIIAPIIDGENIRFASRVAHDFRENSSSGTNEATLRLKAHLETINPSFSISLEEGDLAYIQNDKALHRRSVIPNPSPISNKEATFGERLLARILGPKQQ